jgi:hypothetical protein
MASSAPQSGRTADLSVCQGADITGFIVLELRTGNPADDHEGSGMTDNDGLRLLTASRSLAAALFGSALARGLLH